MGVFHPLRSSRGRYSGSKPGAKKEIPIPDRKYNTAQTGAACGTFRNHVALNVSTAKTASSTAGKFFGRFIGAKDIYLAHEITRKQGRYRYRRQPWHRRSCCPETGRAWRTRGLFIPEQRRKSKGAGRKAESNGRQRQGI